MCGRTAPSSRGQETRSQTGMSREKEGGPLWRRAGLGPGTGCGPARAWPSDGIITKAGCGNKANVFTRDYRIKKKKKKLQTGITAGFLEQMACELHLPQGTADWQTVLGRSPSTEHEQQPWVGNASP